MKKIIRIDFDNIGDKIDFYLFQEDFKSAQEISDIIKIAINNSIVFIKDNFENSEILLVGADDVMFLCDNPNLNKLETLKDFYFENTGLTVSIGVGHNIKEVILNLKEAKVSGKNTIKGL